MLPLEQPATRLARSRRLGRHLYAIVKQTPWSVVVVHDAPTGAMAHLGRLIDRLDAIDVEWHHDLPDACTPIRRGAPTESFAMIEV